MNENTPNLDELTNEEATEQQKQVVEKTQPKNSLTGKPLCIHLLKEMLMIVTHPGKLREFMKDYVIFSKKLAEVKSISEIPQEDIMNYYQGYKYIQNSLLIDSITIGGNTHHVEINMNDIITEDDILNNRLLLDEIANDNSIAENPLRPAEQENNPQPTDDEEDEIMEEVIEDMTNKAIKNDINSDPEPANPFELISLKDFKALDYLKKKSYLFAIIRENELPHPDSQRAETLEKYYEDFLKKLKKPE